MNVETFLTAVEMRYTTFETERDALRRDAVAKATESRADEAALAAIVASYEAAVQPLYVAFMRRRAAVVLAALEGEADAPEAGAEIDPTEVGFVLGDAEDAAARDERLARVCALVAACHERGGVYAAPEVEAAPEAAEVEAAAPVEAPVEAAPVEAAPVEAAAPEAAPEAATT